MGITAVLEPPRIVLGQGTSSEHSQVVGTSEQNDLLWDQVKGVIAQRAATFGEEAFNASGALEKITPQLQAIIDEKRAIVMGYFKLAAEHEKMRAYFDALANKAEASFDTAMFEGSGGVGMFIENISIFGGLEDKTGHQAGPSSAMPDMIKALTEIKTSDRGLAISAGAFTVEVVINNNDEEEAKKILNTSMVKTQTALFKMYEKMRNLLFVRYSSMGGGTTFDAIVLYIELLVEKLYKAMLEQAGVTTKGGKLRPLTDASKEYAAKYKSKTGGLETLKPISGRKPLEARVTGGTRKINDKVQEAKGRYTFVRTYNIEFMFFSQTESDRLALLAAGGYRQEVGRVAINRIAEFYLHKEELLNTFRTVKSERAEEMRRTFFANIRTGRWQIPGYGTV